jgi:hypothetical protein
MINANYVFKLEDESPIETIGGDTTATTLSGSSYTEGDYFQGKHVPTYIVQGQTSGVTVKQSNVKEIIDIHEIAE